MSTPVSPKADLRNDLGDMGYIVFGAILFIWELLPTSLLILIFRVPRPPKEMVSSSGNSNCRPTYLYEFCMGAPHFNVWSTVLHIMTQINSKSLLFPP